MASRPISDEIRQRIVAEYASGQTTSSCATMFGVSVGAVRNIIRLYSETGSVCRKKRQRVKTKSTDIICMKVEYYKQQNASASGKQIQQQLVDDGYCFPDTVPSLNTISNIITKDLGLTRKKLTSIPRESKRPDVEDRFDLYVAEVAQRNPNTLHFFDESSVVQTTANRNYGHAPSGERAYLVQRFASNATRTVNLLHSINGVDFYSIINGASNGLEMLNFFQFVTDEVKDRLGNPVIKPGDTVIMDNCGFHHGNFAEPALRNLLQDCGASLIFQPPYHPELNTCEYVFSIMKSFLRRNCEYADNHLDLAIAASLDNLDISSRNIFRHCGYL